MVHDFKPIGDPIPVGDSPTAITVDPKTGTVYVANSKDNTVSIIFRATTEIHFSTV